MKLFPKADLSPYQVVQFLGSITDSPAELLTNEATRPASDASQAVLTPNH
jgi:hypothetical protein